MNGLIEYFYSCGRPREFEKLRSKKTAKSDGWVCFVSIFIHLFPCILLLSTAPLYLFLYLSELYTAFYASTDCRKRWWMIQSKILSKRVFFNKNSSMKFGGPRAGRRNLNSAFLTFLQVRLLRPRQYIPPASHFFHFISWTQRQEIRPKPFYSPMRLTESRHRACILDVPD